MQPHATTIRPASFRYPIKSHSDYLFGTGRGAKRQILAGVVGNAEMTVEFDDEGNLLSTRAEPFGRRSSNRTDSVHDLVREACLNAGVVPDVRIEVRRFHLDSHLIGIDDIPEDLAEFLNHPMAFPKSQHDDLKAAIDAWQQEALFVFWWGQSFYMDLSGSVTSS
jgi:hypothetical protein